MPVSEGRQAQPDDRTVPPDKCRRLQVADHAVVLDQPATHSLRRDWRPGNSGASAVECDDDLDVVVVGLERLGVLLEGDLAGHQAVQPGPVRCQ